MTEIRPIAYNSKSVFYPVTHYQAVKQLDDGVVNAITTNPDKVIDGVKNSLETWHTGLTPTSIKLQSPSGAVFLISVDDDGNVLTTKEGDNDGSTTGN